MADHDLCCNCKYAEIIDTRDGTKIKCTRKFNIVRNVRDTFHKPLFLPFRKLTSFACPYFIDK